MTFLHGHRRRFSADHYRHPQEKLGEMAAELILEKINGIPEEESKSKD